MSTLRSYVDPKSEGFRRNAEAYEELLAELRERSAAARRGGGEKARDATRSAANCSCETG